MLLFILNVFLMFLDVVLLLLFLHFILVRPVRDSFSLRSMCLRLLESLGQRLNLTPLLLNSLIKLQEVLSGLLQLPIKQSDG